MHSKPDIIRTLLLVFAIGLAVTGVTSLQANAGDSRDASVRDLEQLNGAVAASQPAVSVRED